MQRAGTPLQTQTDTHTHTQSCQQQVDQKSACEPTHADRVDTGLEQLGKHLRGAGCWSDCDEAAVDRTAVGVEQTSVSNQVV